MRVGRELLAAATRLAAGGRVGRVALAVANQTGGSQPDRLLPFRGRFLVDLRSWVGRKTCPSPTDRARPGSKHHIATDAHGTSIAAILAGANRHDVTQLIPLNDSIAPNKGVRGRPLSRPRRVFADRGYDHDKNCRILHERGIPTSIARRGKPRSSGLGKVHWVVERTHAWLHHFRRLRICFERRVDIHEAFLKPGCFLICWNTLQRNQKSL